MKNQSNNIRLKSKDGKEVPHSHEGSLGLLALGDVGLHLWRQLITEHAKNQATINGHSDAQIKTEEL